MSGLPALTEPGLRRALARAGTLVRACTLVRARTLMRARTLARAISSE